MNDWKPVFVLPNVVLKAAIGCDIAALAPADDRRVTALKRAQPMFHEFLGRFSDNFGEKFEPAVLLLRADTAPRMYTVAALASFRDLIAISAIVYNRASALLQPKFRHVTYGEAFAIYPWMIDRHYEMLVGSTAAFLGIHDVEKFQGQSSPTIFRTALDAGNLDQPLLTELLDRWQRRYLVAEEQWADIALFRSLNMAYHASLLPAATDTTFYDIGRLISLWVSAFEILVHPGGNGQANREKVFALIERTPWTLEAASLHVEDLYSNAECKKTLASWLYKGLYKCRNDFLHGNPVDGERLIVPSSRNNILEYAAPLYRLALTAFLPLTFDQPVPSLSCVDAFGARVAKRIEFLEPQRIAEKAILTANRALDEPPCEA